MDAWSLGLILALALLAGALAGAWSVSRWRGHRRRPSAQATAHAVPDPAVSADAHADDGGEPRFVYVDGGQIPGGPVGLSTLRAMRLDGRLGDGAYVAAEGSHEWRPLSHWLDEAATGPIGRDPVVPRPGRLRQPGRACRPRW